MGLAGLAFFVALAFVWGLMCRSDLVERIGKIAEGDPRAFARAVLLGLASVCIASGLPMGWLMTVRPIMLLMRARTWTSTSCLIVKSLLTSHDTTTQEVDSGGRRRLTTRTSYGHDLLHSYEIGGRQYQGSRYRFFESSAGEEENRAVVERFRTGATVRCFVDPRQPEESVLERRAGREAAWGLVPLLMLAVGVGSIGVLKRIPRADSK